MSFPENMFGNNQPEIKPTEKQVDNERFAAQGIDTQMNQFDDIMERLDEEGEKIEDPNHNQAA